MTSTSSATAEAAADPLPLSHKALVTVAQTKGLPQLEIRPTRFGKGVFALKDIRPGDTILQFRGRLYSRKEYLSKMNPNKCYYMQIGEDLFLGPTTSADNFVNHCCSPNAGLKIQKGKCFLVAVDAIKTGHEITFDYSTSMAEDHWEMDCACGASSCRTRIRDFKYIPAALQTHYIQLGIVPDFVLRSSGITDPYDLFQAAEPAPELQTLRIAHA